MQFNCSLSLPRDARMVPIARHFCQNAMSEFGVTPSCGDAVALALTEACANVVDHSDDTSDFEITIALDDKRCIIRVIDKGSGFDTTALEQTSAPDVRNDRGRGVFLMKTLMDKIHFDSKPELGTVVRLEKELEFSEDAPHLDAAEN